MLRIFTSSSRLPLMTLFLCIFLISLNLSHFQVQAKEHISSSLETQESRAVKTTDTSSSILTKRKVDPSKKEDLLDDDDDDEDCYSSENDLEELGLKDAPASSSSSSAAAAALNTMESGVASPAAAPEAALAQPVAGASGSSYGTGAPGADAGLGNLGTSGSGVPSGSGTSGLTGGSGLSSSSSTVPPASAEAMNSDGTTTQVPLSSLGPPQKIDITSDNLHPQVSSYLKFIATLGNKCYSWPEFIEPIQVGALNAVKSQLLLCTDKGEVFLRNSGVGASMDSSVNPAAMAAANMGGMGGNGYPASTTGWPVNAGNNMTPMGNPYPVNTNGAGNPYASMSGFNPLGGMPGGNALGGLPGSNGLGGMGGTGGMPGGNPYAPNPASMFPNVTPF